MVFRRSLAIIVLIVASLTSAIAQQKVELELVLAVDTSTSVDEDEYELQRTGIAEAFRHPQVLRAIESLGPDGMAISVVQWSGAAQQRLAVDWKLVDNANAALQLADEIEAMQRLLTGFTDIAGAIKFSTNTLLNNNFEGRRLTIDVSGDGTSDRNDPAIARDAAILQGITVNGLIIHSIEYDLGDLARFDLHTHYSQRVIGGPGAFLLNAESFKTFATSMREKLYREISGPLFAQSGGSCTLCE